MRIVKLTDLRNFRSGFDKLEIFPEAWDCRRSFSQYRNTPRPMSAFFLVCGEMHATYYPRTQAPVSIEKGDLLWIPSGSLYRMDIDRGAATRLIPTR